MWLVWVGVVLVALKALAVGPVAQWSWWWILAPLLAAVAWFEGVERLLGRDRRVLAHDEMRRRQRERAEHAFGQARRRGGRRGG